jgi:precorrin-2 dehydrogenase / sirohydrochlorin ferrochelatase
MRRLPVNLRIEGKRVVVIGGGSVALRKCRSLLDAGGDVVVVSPDLSSGLRKLVEDGEIRHEGRPYRDGDLDGAFIAFATAGDPAVNRSVAAEAERRGILADVADDPLAGSFTSPASVRRGELLLTVSTGDGSPAFARKVRQELEERFGAEYGEALRIAAALRRKLLTESGNTAYNGALIDRLLASDLPGLLKRGDTAAVDRLLRDIAGPDATLDRLEREDR